MTRRPRATATPLFVTELKGGSLLALTCVCTCCLRGKEGLQPLPGRLIPQRCCLLVTPHRLSQVPLHAKALLIANSQVVPALRVLMEKTDRYTDTHTCRTEEWKCNDFIHTGSRPSPGCPLPRDLNHEKPEAQSRPHTKETGYCPSTRGESSQRYMKALSLRLVQKVRSSDGPRKP